MTWSSRSRLFRCNGDRWFTIVTRGSALLAAIPACLIVLFLIQEAWPALRQWGPSRFFTDPSWHPLSGRFNLLPMVIGTCLTTLGAMVLAGPLGIASALFSVFYAPPGVAWWHRRLVELLAGIPSVVYGLWGLVVLVPLLGRGGGSGQSLLAATLVLALMVLPLVALTSAAALSAVPAETIRGAAALGLGRRAIACRIAIPAARGGIVAGLLLATARALGETMAVVMLSGNVPQWPRSFLSPVRTLTGNLALEMGYATSAHRSVLFVSGLALLGLVGLLVIVADRAEGGRDA